MRIEVGRCIEISDDLVYNDKVKATFGPLELVDIRLYKENLVLKAFKSFALLFQQHRREIHHKGFLYEGAMGGEQTVHKAAVAPAHLEDDRKRDEQSPFNKEAAENFSIGLAQLECLYIGA